MNPVTVSAPAKLNLALHITGRRSDGFHLLQSLVAFTPFGDQLHMEPASDISLSLTGPFADDLKGTEDNNLVVRAAKLLQSQAGITLGARITLDKRIPVSAGLGGGSSDAAATLKGLMRLWNLSDQPGLESLAIKLGSDVPACLTAAPAWVGGIGEQIEPVKWGAKMGVVLVNPRQPLSTAEVYGKFHGRFSADQSVSSNIDSAETLFAAISLMRNDLESPAVSILPVIRDVLSAVRKTSGCFLARMSGSGATCFGLFADEGQAGKAAERIRKEQPSWWCVPTSLEPA